jgi:hypothetical protein
MSILTKSDKVLTNYSECIEKYCDRIIVGSVTPKVLWAVTIGLYGALFSLIAY